MLCDSCDCNYCDSFQFLYLVFGIFLCASYSSTVPVAPIEDSLIMKQHRIQGIKNTVVCCSNHAFDSVYNDFSSQRMHSLQNIRAFSAVLQRRRAFSSIFFTNISVSMCISNKSFRRRCFQCNIQIDYVLFIRSRTCVVSLVQLAYVNICPNYMNK